MAPPPQGIYGEEMPPKKIKPALGEEVVISGISGIFPMSESVEEFSKNLYDKVDMVSSDNSRGGFDHPEVPKQQGKIKGMGKFDAQFFRVHQKQAASMEPMSRKLLEHAYSAIYDSGTNYFQLRGKKVGVFVGSNLSDSEKVLFYDKQPNGFVLSGCSKSMYANRISYWIDGTGPSYTLNLSCASSMACLEHAYQNINSGHCDAAIVGACNMCINPMVSLNFKRAGCLCLDGKTRCFDKNGTGYVRSDAISVMFLQKAKDAKRIYSEVYHVKSNTSSTSEQVIPIREPEELQKFFEEFYSEIDVSPADVEYVEANGAALVEVDSKEMIAIGKVFAKTHSIKIGCVKSNMGSSEPASGLCGLTKVCLAFQHGKIPGNLHYNNPIDIPEVKENKVQVLTDTTNFRRRFVALNSFSYGGANVHVLLKGHYKEKNDARYKSSIPYLVLLSGRQENCVNSFMDALKTKSIDFEVIGLLHNIHQYDIPNHMSRGYIVLDTDADKQTVALAQNVEYYPGTPRPLWFVYSGMGSQWATMGAELMRIPIFAAAIHKCHKVLEPKGIDIVRILTDPDKTIYDNILHSFVGISAVQIGLTDILTQLGVVPDNIIGHSLGEVGCAYADGCFTAEETILAAYYRGLVTLQTPLIRGSMAAVGLGYNNISHLCPPEITVACHNSADSATISGPADIMKEFVAELKAKGIFAREVSCSNIAFHTQYVADAGTDHLKYLKELIKTPKLRSEKWISTSVPEEKWNETNAKYSSAEYHNNNMMNCVLFEETSKLIPSDALVIEIAPHGLLQAILKRSLSECINVPITRRETPDPVKFLLEAIGKLYNAGLNIKIDVLYPKIEFPVSSKTPLLSQYVKWEHSEDWPQIEFNKKDRIYTSIRNFVMSIYDDEYSYMRGHIRNGNYVFPEAALLQLVWENLAMSEGVNYRNMSVVFRDVHFYKEVVIPPNNPLRLKIMIFRGSNKFEISYEESTIVSGFVNKFEPSNHQSKIVEKLDDSDNETLSTRDVYTILRLKGYSYMDDFQSIYSSNFNRTKANIKWTENWVPFLDSILQFNAFAKDRDGVSTPTIIRNLSINIKKHNDAIQDMSADLNVVSAELHSIYEYTKCGGVEVEGLIFKDRKILEQEQDNTFTQEFVPYFAPGIVENQCNGYNKPNSGEKFNKPQNLQLMTTTTLDSDIKQLVWVKQPSKSTSNLQVQVCYAGPSFRDAQNAAPKTRNHENVYGMDFSGINNRGEKVMGLIPGGAISATVEADPDLLWPVPEHWTLEDAATVPLPYILAYYCLSKCNYMWGMNVFVHGGAGALGQAVIAVCQSLGYNVYTTVSSLKKRELLLRLFPDLSDKNISCSSNDLFRDKVCSSAGNDICSVIINCLSGKRRKATIKCCGAQGIFLDLNDEDMLKDEDFEMGFLAQSKRYLAVKLSSIFRPEFPMEKKQLQMKLSEGIAKGVVRPLTRVVYCPVNVSSAFRLVGSSKHIGKVLIKIKNLESSSEALKVQTTRMAYSSNGTYIVVCDNEIILGMELADRLVKQGAKKLVIQHMKSNSLSGYCRTKLTSWNKRNVTVNISTDNLQTEKDCINLIKEGAKLGSILGIFIVQNFSGAKSLESVESKFNNTAGVAAMLDLTSRNVCNELDYFVVLNHATEKNIEEYDIVSATDAICNARKKKNFPALSFSIGLINEIDKDSHRKSRSSITGVFNALEASLKSKDRHAILFREKTIADFKNIEKTSSKVTLNTQDGFGAFITYIDSDECMAAEPLVTLATSYCCVTEEAELDQQATSLMLMPGFEGHHEVFSTLCERLKIQAVAFQYDPELYNANLPEIAADAMKSMKKRFQLDGKFYILGYSFGVNVALELAALYEQEGHVGTVYCLDSSPDALRAQLNAFVGNFNVVQLQNNLIQHMYKLMNGQNSEELVKKLEKNSTWEEKIELCVNGLKINAKFSHQYMKCIIQGAYRRIMLAREYQPNFKLQSELVLIKGIPHPNMKTLEHDYGLSKYTTKPVQVFDIEADHASAPHDCHVTSIVNRLLDPKLQEAFKTKNLCWSYLIE